MDTGYSSTPQLTKLGLLPGVRYDVVGASDGWRFETYPVGLERVAPDAPADVIVVFCRSAAEVEVHVEAQGSRIRPAGALWIAWPRKAAGHDSDVSDSVLRELILPTGLVDTKVAAIDTDWSGLKFVWRLANR